MAETKNDFRFKNAHYKEDIILSFGQDDKAIQALETQAILVPIVQNGFLRVSGADRLDFLQGQITNDVKRLQVSAFNEALMLNHKGHALAQMRVLKSEQDLLVIVEDNALKLVQEQLQRHIIFDQVKLEPLDTKLTLSVQGLQAAKLVADLNLIIPTEGQFLKSTFKHIELTLYPARRSVVGGFDITVNKQDASFLLEALEEKGGVKAGTRVADIARVLAVIPKVATEAGEAVLPQEAGLDHAISYTKGCYLGQEIMARIEARGHLRRGLQILKFSSLPEPGSKDIRQEGKLVGRLGQVIEHPEKGILGLAVLRTDITQADLEISGVTAQRITL